MDYVRMKLKLNRNSSRRLRTTGGFTLLELMVSVAIIAILAAIAVPSYSTYVNQSRAKGASSDLVAMSLALENDFQKTLAYPVYSTATTIPALPANRTGNPVNDFLTWSPAEGNYYSYSVSSTASSYTVTATATGTINCTLTLTNQNVRTASGTNCGFTSW
jgi:type IV pilus assembly protein PilE